MLGLCETQPKECFELLDSSVGIGTRLRSGRPRNRGSILDSGTILNLLPTISRSAQVIANVGNEGALPRGKNGLVVYLTIQLPSSAGFKNEWN